MKWKIFIEPIVEAIMGQFPIEAGTISWIAAIRTIFGGSVYMNKTFNQLLCIKLLISRCKNILDFGMVSHKWRHFFEKKKSEKIKLYLRCFLFGLIIFEAVEVGTSKQNTKKKKHTKMKNHACMA